MTTAAAPDVPGYDFPVHRVDVGGYGMSYVDVAPPDDPDAPPVLLVHGNPTWSFYWRSLLRALPTAGRRAIAPDHIGMGLSDKPADHPHTLPRRVADLTRFVDSLGLDRPVSLVVHDWGGPIGLSWAVEHPEMVDRIVVLNSAAFPLPEGHRIPWTLQAARLPVVGEFLVRRLNAFSLGALVLGTGRTVLPAEARRGLLAPYDSPAHRRAVHDFVRDIPTSAADPAQATLEQLADGLPRLAHLPTTICWGMRDPVFDAAILDELVARMPHAVVHRFPDAGHYVLEDATDEITAIVTRELGVR